jgi:hypothetical protein
MRDLRICTDRASDFFTEQVGKLWSNIWVLLLIDVATMVLVWLLAWIVIRLVRWVSRGFARFLPDRPVQPGGATKSAIFNC